MRNEIIFKILNKIHIIITTCRKRELSRSSLSKDLVLNEYKIFSNTSIKFTRIILIIVSFNLIGFLTKNSYQEVVVLGYSFIAWKFILVLSLLIAIIPLCNVLNNDKPSLIITEYGIKLKYRGYFKWTEISNIMIENEINEDLYDNINLILEKDDVWYRLNIDELTLKKEEIESLVSYFWNDKKSKKNIRL